jgi:hypothetical protein
MEFGPEVRRFAWAGPGPEACAWPAADLRSEAGTVTLRRDPAGVQVRPDGGHE